MGVVIFGFVFYGVFSGNRPNRLKVLGFLHFNRMGVSSFVNFGCDFIVWLLGC
jgi:hypothetical protein